MPNLIYSKSESLNAVYRYIFSSGVTHGRNVQMDMRNLPAGSGRISAVCDLGTDPRPSFFQVRSKIRFSGSLPTHSPVAEVYAVESNRHDELPGNLASGDSMISAAKLNNLSSPIAVLIADSPTNGEWQISMSRPFQINNRFVALAVRNLTSGTSFHATDGSELTLIPFVWEIQ